jgi:hypothetical protein
MVDGVAGVIGFGLKLAVSPAGNPLALRVTFPLKPFSAKAEMV